jgi:NAD-dependent SIR2 family protein deacetylase
MDRRERSGRIIYFLGAGASKSICPWLPISSELTLERLADRTAYPSEILVPPETDQLSTFLRNWSDTEKYRRAPLEDALQAVRALDQDRYENPYGLVLWCLGKRLSVRNYDHRPFSSFERWLNAVRENRDVIITTNYDLLIESAHANMPPGEFLDSLHCIDFGVTKERVHEMAHRAWPGGAPSSVLFLKLHGSISWLFCKKCGKYGLDPIWDNAWESTVFSGAYPPCPECKERGTRRPVFVPPLKRKELEDAAIRDIWNVAGRILQEASQIVFAGFSLSVNDGAIRTLLSAAFEQGSTRRVTVIDPNPAIEANYTGIYRDIVEISAERNWRGFLDKSFGVAERYEHKLVSARSI